MLNVLSLFSGIGAFEKALKNLNIPYNLLAYCEIDKHASKAFSIIHNEPEEKNLKDVTKIDMLDIVDTVDLITYGFPCQDISNAGKQKGFTDENDERTRSGLFFEALRIIDDYKPKFAIAENVKALTSKKFSEEFKTVLESLDRIGYNNYWRVLNAKDYGIPQNRERVFIISIRKDIDKGFTFPGPVPLELKLKDLLEPTVDESFYIETNKFKDFVFELDTPACAASRGRNPENPSDRTAGAPTVQRLEINKNGTTNTITTVQKDNYIVEPCVAVREATKKGYTEAYPGDSVNLQFPNSKTRRGRVGKEISQTLQCNDQMGVVVDE